MDLTLKNYYNHVRCMYMTPGPQEIPYVMMHYGKNLTGNERFFGFCVDILSRVANEVGFEYILDLVPDKKYGARDPVTGEWNGMVSQLMQHVSRWADVILELISSDLWHFKSEKKNKPFCDWQLLYVCVCELECYTLYLGLTSDLDLFVYPEQSNKTIDEQRAIVQQNHENQSNR